MTNHQSELLSALVDGELEGQALDEALRLIQSDPQARQRWQRFQIMSDILQGHVQGQPHYDLTARISAAVEQEPALKKPKLGAKIIAMPRRIWKQAAGFALAASLGALVVTGGLTPFEQAPSPDAATITVASSNPAASEGKSRWSVDEKEVEQRLDSYLIEHNEYANAPDAFSYARVVSYETGK